MKKPIAAALMAAVLATPVALPTAAVAQRWQGDQDGNWDPANGYHDRNYGRPIGQNERIYHGSDGRYYCKRSNGTTGLVLGAVGGGLIGSALGGGALGTILGAGGGALLGKNLDERHDAAQNRQNGYYCR